MGVSVGRGLGRPLLLERRQAAGEAADQVGQASGEAGERGREAAGELGEQLLACGQAGEAGDVRARQVGALEQAPFTVSASGCSAAKPFSAFAATAASPATQAMAVGPSRYASRASRPVSAAARRARLFLTTVNSVPASRRRPRSSAICFTVSPR